MKFQKGINLTRQAWKAKQASKHLQTGKSSNISIDQRHDGKNIDIAQPTNPFPLPFLPPSPSLPLSPTSQKEKIKQENNPQKAKPTQPRVETPSRGKKKGRRRRRRVDSINAACLPACDKIKRKRLKRLPPQFPFLSTPRWFVCFPSSPPAWKPRSSRRLNISKVALPSSYARREERGEWRWYLYYFALLSQPRLRAPFAKKQTETATTESNVVKDVDPNTKNRYGK